MSSPRQEATGRACPHCHRRTDRVARRWLDRVLSVFMPVVRYRCASAECGWEGLLMRHGHKPPLAGRQRRSAYRPQRLDASRLDKLPRR